MLMTKISVIIPLYNKGKLIERALDSVFSQTYQDFEVIVVDDGSTDGSADFVRAYQDCRLTLISQDNSGPGAARNHGVQKSRGEYLAFLDADDEWLSGFLEESVLALDSNPDCQAVASNFFLGPEKLNRFEMFGDFTFQDGLWDVQGNEIEYLIKPLSSSSTVFRKEAYLKCGGFYDKERCNCGEDVFLEVVFMFNYSLYINTTPLAWYHIENSVLTYDPGKRNDVSQPVFIDVDSLYKLVPKGFHFNLKKWLSCHATEEIFWGVDNNRRDYAKSLYESFYLKRFDAKTLQIYFKVYFPRVYVSFKSLLSKLFFLRRFSALRKEH